MLPVALTALVPKFCLMGMKGVQALESTTTNVDTINSRMRDRPPVGPEDCGQISPRAQDRVEALRSLRPPSLLTLAARTCVRNPCRLQGCPLASSECRLVEIVDQLVKYPIPVDLGSQVEEYRAEPDRGAVHEHKFARRPDSAEPTDVAMHAVGNRSAVDTAHLFLDQPRAVFEQRAVDEQSPAVQHVNDLARQIAEPPALIGMHREVAVAALQSMVEIDDAAHERRAKNSDAPEIQQIDG